MRNTLTKNAKPHSFATLKDFDDAVETATQHLKQTEEQQAEMIKQVIDEVVNHKPKSSWYDELWFPIIVLSIGIAAVLLSFAKSLPQLLLK